MPIDQKVENAHREDAFSDGANQAHDVLSQAALFDAIKDSSSTTSSQSKKDAQSKPEATDTPNHLPPITVDGDGKHGGCFGGKIDGERLQHIKDILESHEVRKDFLQKNSKDLPETTSAAGKNGEQTDCFGGKEALRKAQEKLEQSDLKNNAHEVFPTKVLTDASKPKDGVEQLKTGDYLVREDGKTTLFTPSGDHISINPDGSHTIKGNVKSATTDKNGVTTVEFADGAKVEFGKEGFKEIKRDGKDLVFIGGRPFDITQMFEKLKPYEKPQPHYEPAPVVPGSILPYYNYKLDLNDPPTVIRKAHE